MAPGPALSIPGPRRRPGRPGRARGDPGPDGRRVPRRAQRGGAGCRAVLRRGDRALRTGVVRRAADRRRRRRPLSGPGGPGPRGRAMRRRAVGVWVLLVAGVVAVVALTGSTGG